MLTKETVVFKTIDNVDIHADVYLPKSHTLKNQYAAILYLHGGGMVVGNRTMMPEMETAGFLEQGWIVVSSDYRLIPETKYPEACQDAFDAYDWMRTEGSARYGINENKIAIIGSSAGARLALLAGYKMKRLPCCILSLYAQTDFRLNGESWQRLRSPKVSEEDAFSAVYKHGIRTSTSPESELYHACLSYLAWAAQNDEILRAYFGEHYQRGSILEQYSPCLNVHSQFPPTLIVHGTEDSLTPYIHASIMHQALTDKQVKCDIVPIPG